MPEQTIYFRVFVSSTFGDLIIEYIVKKDLASLLFMIVV
jgi:hypothetical protein